MKKFIWIVTTLSLAASIGCTKYPSMMKGYFYVGSEPSGYLILADSPNGSNSMKISGPMSFEDATALVNQLNHDIEGHDGR